MNRREAKGKRFSHTPRAHQEQTKKTSRAKEAIADCCHCEIIISTWEKFLLLSGSLDRFHQLLSATADRVFRQNWLLLCLGFVRPKSNQPHEMNMRRRKKAQEAFSRNNDAPETRDFRCRTSSETGRGEEEREERSKRLSCNTSTNAKCDAIDWRKRNRRNDY